MALGRRKKKKSSSEPAAGVTFSVRVLFAKLQTMAPLVLNVSLGIHPRKIIKGGLIGLFREGEPSYPRFCFQGSIFLVPVTSKSCGRKTNSVSSKPSFRRLCIFNAHSRGGVYQTPFLMVYRKFSFLIQRHNGLSYDLFTWIKM